MIEYFNLIKTDLKVGSAIVFVCLILICIACFIDLWTGIDAARVNKEKIKSRPLRKTGAKIIDYFRLVIMFLLLDLIGISLQWYSMPYGAIVITVGTLVIEGLSVIENLRKKKSHAAEVADFALEIINCNSKEGAKELIKKIKSKAEKK